MHHEPPTQLARNWQCLPGRNLFLALLAFVLAADPAPAAEPRTVKVAAVPCSSQLGEVAANTQKLTRLIREAAAHGAKIVVLPEAAITGYLSQDGTTNGRVSRSPQTEEVWAHGRTPDHLLFIADDRRRGGYFIPIGNDEIGRGLQHEARRGMILSWKRKMPQGSALPTDPITTNPQPEHQPNLS